MALDFKIRRNKSSQNGTINNLKEMQLQTVLNSEFLQNFMFVYSIWTIRDGVNTKPS